jgi:hypothetical protein
MMIDNARENGVEVYEGDSCAGLSAGWRTSYRRSSQDGGKLKIRPITFAPGCR